MNLKIISWIETIYLIYMYFIHKTNFSFNSAIFDKQVNSMGSFFIHDTGYYENKICPFGKFMAIIAVILLWIRYYYLINTENYSNIIIKITIIFNLTCVILAGLMNLNALVYIIPLIISEIYVNLTLASN